MAAKRKPTSRRTASKRPSKRRWSAQVTKHSDALDLERRVFTRGSPKSIARSLKRSATSSKRRKGTPYQSAMSTLNFYINRAGRNLPGAQKQRLQKAKAELRKEFGRD